MTSSDTKNDFLPHVQGLSAIAVAMVLLFHFRLLGAHGGFAGVDVFFVISGYLMTAILIRNSDQPLGPMLLAFYAKRIRRIAPAYFAVLGSPTCVVSANGDELSTTASRALLTEELDAALSGFSKAGKKAVLFMQVPELTANGKRCFIISKVDGADLENCNVSRAAVDQRQANYRSILESLARKWDNVIVVDVNDQLCGPTSCKATLDGELAYKDNNHLLTGASYKLLSSHQSRIFGN